VFYLVLVSSIRTEEKKHRVELTLELDNNLLAKQLHRFL